MVQDLIKNNTIELCGQQFASKTDHTIHKNLVQDDDS